VPEHHLAFVVVKLEQRNRAGAFQGSGHVPKLARVA
jgi:hypothetical protein